MEKYWGARKQIAGRKNMMRKATMREREMETETAKVREALRLRPFFWVEIQLKLKRPDKNGQ